jgi:SAM-dependent methyltransferase
MHRRVYQQFEKICTDRNVGGRVLEIGATPDDSSLLCMESLVNATQKIGINLGGPYRYRDFEILQGNANDMACFADESFDLVLCNAVLEHDKFFYKSLSEIKRVTRSGGVIAIGVPGYRRIRGLERFQSLLGRIPLVRRLNSGGNTDALFTATLAFKVHDHPGDYYRFSPQAVEEVFFHGCSDVSVTTVMLTPRIIGSGVKV